MSRWRGGVASKDALSDNKDERDDPKAQQELSIVFIRPVIHKSRSAINHFVRSRSLGKGGKLAHRIEAEDSCDNHGAQIVKAEQGLQANGDKSERIDPNSDREDDRLDRENEHGGSTDVVDVGPAGANRLAFSIAVREQELVVLCFNSIDEGPILEVEVVERAVRAVDLMIFGE